MVDPLDAAVGAGVVGAGVDLADANAVVDDGRQLRGELLTIVGEERHRAPPERDVLVEQDAGSSGGREVFCRGSERVGPAAETVGKETDMHVPALELDLR